MKNTKYDEDFEYIITKGLNEQEVEQVEYLDLELTNIKDELLSADIFEEVVEKIFCKIDTEVEEFIERNEDEYEYAYDFITDKVEWHGYNNTISEILYNSVETKEYVITKDADEFVVADNDEEILRVKDLDCTIDHVEIDFKDHINNQIEKIIDKETIWISDEIIKFDCNMI